MAVYPEEIFNRDLEKLKSMNIPFDDKKELGNALAYVFHSQESNGAITHSTVRNCRENILGKDLV